MDGIQYVLVLLLKLVALLQIVMVLCDQHAGRLSLVVVRSGRRCSGRRFDVCGTGSGGNGEDMGYDCGCGPEEMVVKWGRGVWVGQKENFYCLESVARDDHKCFGVWWGEEKGWCESISVCRLSRLRVCIVCVCVG